jgi:hypothetical protein
MTLKKYCPTPFLNLLLGCLLMALSMQTSSAGEDKGDSSGVPIDIAWVIDVSGSTGGILPVVRDKFWELQNEMSRLTPTAKYRLSIICMGRPSFKKENNYINKMSDLTDDIDAVAFPFFQLKDLTAPGNYQLGYALDIAMNELSWSKDPNALKVVFVLGNGLPSKGPGCEKAIKKAKENGIILHSLYFQTYDNAKERAEWQSLAEATGGKYFSIGLREPNITFEKAYDNDLLLEACRMINTTYVPYGPNGVSRLDAQASLDEDAEIQGEFAFEARTFFKATPLYQVKNASWDLVDLLHVGKFKPEKISRKDPPGVLSQMSDEDLHLHVTEMSYNRAEYISIIKMLTTRREEHMRNMREKMMVYRFGNTFFGVMNRTMVEMAESKGYKHEY